MRTIALLLAGVPLIVAEPEPSWARPSPVLAGQAATLDALLIYHGTWKVTAQHPWSGSPAGTVDRLRSDCHRYTAYVACEQSINGKPLALIVYTPGEGPGTFHTRTIAPSGLAGGRGSMTMAGDKWTYLDRPAAGLTGPWSRVENVIASPNRITFDEYESTDDGKTWRLVNRGVEERAEG